MKNLILVTISIFASGCVAPQASNTFKPRAYANVKTWDVGFMFDNASKVMETIKEEGGKEITTIKEDGKGDMSLSLREDIYYCMLGRAGFKMAPQGQVADATVKLSFDTYYIRGGNYGIVNLTVFDRNGEPLSRLKYENPYPDMSLQYRERMVMEIVTLLVEEVNANK